jgi:hypothetical protein
MGNKNLTAVDWLANELVKKGFPIEKYGMDLLEQAKAMEKEQIIKANEDASTNELGEFLNGKQYFTETYESNGTDDHLPDVRGMVEISDEEIIKLANEYILYNDSKRQWVIEGMKLYREQLKKK